MPKRIFPLGNGKVALLRASMVVTYYIKLFRTGADRHNGILMSHLLLVAETKMDVMSCWLFLIISIGFLITKERILVKIYESKVNSSILEKMLFVLMVVKLFRKHCARCFLFVSSAEFHLVMNCYKLLQKVAINLIYV